MPDVEASTSATYQPPTIKEQAMTADTYWTISAIERGAGRVPMRLLLGECDDGLLYAPTPGKPDHWGRRFTWCKPWLWRYWLASRLLRRLVWLEPSDG